MNITEIANRIANLHYPDIPNTRGDKMFRRQRVIELQKLVENELKNCSIPDVSARYSLKDMEQIFFAGYFHRPIKNDDTEEGLDSAFKAVIDRHNSNVR